MQKYLLDTNICVFLLRGKFNIEKKIIAKGLDNCFISEITVSELLYGIECDYINSQRNREKVEDLVDLLTVVPIKDALQEYAKQKAQLKRQGKLIDDLDIFIGATAIANDMILVTDNEKHFNRLSNIKIENWVKK